MGSGYVEVALSEAVEAMAEPLRYGTTTPGALLGGGVPEYNIYRTSDGWVAVAALEPLGPQETNFLVTTPQAIELAERIASPHVRLHLDCKAMATEAEPIPELICKYRRELVHFHANDPNRQGPGFGSLDFRPILRALGEIDYRGWVSVEVFDYSPGIERLTAQSIAYLQGCLLELAES